ncbi:hypothetical protein H2201_008070 [Coniosporium apollinis]|uniref:Uncharacterized protein n=1 Tax=Coniosporium apollinis TaxID=61459 RepID=A0ABQ9NKK8_9PEZI|nr:hypothetical protein H2201_008070 [Coniosporium apollinis]
MLQTFGDVVMFKSLKYEQPSPAPNTAIAIFSHAESASKVLKASPLRFTLERVSGEEATRDQDDNVLEDNTDDAEFVTGRGSGRTDAEELVRPSTLLHSSAGEGKWGSFGQSQSVAVPDQPPPEPSSSDPSHTAADTSDLPTTDPNPAEEHAPSAKEFKLIADVSTMDHRKYLELSPYYYGFNIRKSLITDDLAKSVPLRGLSEINPKNTETPVRKAQRRAAEVANRKTLRQLWQIGMKRKEEAPPTSEAYESPSI